MIPMVPVFLKTETLFPLALAIARSGLPSSFKSPMAIPIGRVPPFKSTLTSNDPELIVPPVAMFLRMEILLLLQPTTISCLPSPSTSRTANEYAPDEVAKSTFDKNEIEPEVELFLYTLTEALPPLKEIISCLPSPSKSPVVIP